MSLKIEAIQPGQELPESPWVEITQNRINQFAEATGDHQWIHVDQERAARESPFKTTIAHGFLTTTLMPSLFYDMIEIDPSRQALLNYGVDRLRFLEPVRAGDQIRYKVTLLERQQKTTGMLYRFESVVEIQGREKPAMVATMLMLLVGH